MQPIDPLSSAKLIQDAKAARKQAYAPYSKFQVGAAILTSNGQVVTGCNVENASYGLSICAERAALFHAVALGHRHFSAIAICLPNRGSPCGACRQVLSEFNRDLMVYMANESGDLIRESSLGHLLPLAFGPDHLELAPTPPQSPG